MFNYKNYRVLLICGPTDCRKSIDGLCALVMNQFQLNPKEDVIFAFCNRARNRIKLLVWDDNGFWLHLKRLERGSLPWPDICDTEETMKFSISDFENLVKSPGIKQKIKRQEVW